MDRSRDFFYIDARAMQESSASMIAHGVVMDLMVVLWWPTKQPFAWDIPAIVSTMNAKFPARDYTEAALREHEADIRSFFTVLPDGRWAPSPKFFSMSDGNPGSQS